MAKRRRSPSSDDENWSRSDNAHASADSEFDDASYEKYPKSARSKKKKITTRKGAEDPKINVSLSNNESTHNRSLHLINEPEVMREALLGWYKNVHTIRGMPWRKPYDPSAGPSHRAQRAYEVWISEIMLQQTQVATVIPYYNRWMARFPTIEDLAEASIDEVNALWKGLGYYSRASRLLAGAQKAVKDYGGRLPTDAKSMEANIPGIGRYSAGAICSIAYGENAPVLDGNVHRLMSRLLALHAPPKSKPTLDILWNGARAMVDIDNSQIDGDTDTELSAAFPKPPQYPGDVNQALIELGSTVCKVREAKCEACPLQIWCGAYQLHTNAKSEGIQANNITDIEDICQLCEPIPASQGVHAFPMKVERKKSREESDLVHVIEWRSRTDPTDRRFLMTKRPEGGLLAGLYDFPTSVNVSSTLSAAKREGLLMDILLQLFPDASLIPPTKHKEIRGNQFTMSNIKSATDVLHIFSHIRKTYKPQWAVIESDDIPPHSNGPSSDIIPVQKSSKRITAKVKLSQATQRAEKHDTVNEVLGNIVWVPLQEVMQTNMGTGVVKVWNVTTKLWEELVDNDT